MTNILDDYTQIKKIDKSNVLGSVEALPDQCLHAWEEASKVKVPENFRKVEKLVMTGMGGSGLGARVIESVFQNQLKIPLTRVNNYALPPFVDQQTLVICSSYSGSTEEVVENVKQALAKKAKTMVVATGGPVIKLALKYHLPYYQIRPTYNPSQQPRMAVGYSIIGQLALANRAGIIKLTDKKVKKVVLVMRQTQQPLKIDIAEAKNLAKKLAKKMYNKMIAYAAARHLSGPIHVVKNQLNENAKTFAARFDIPELNHHLMEGLRFPKKNQDNLFFFLANSKLYHPRIQERMVLTQEVIEKNKVPVYLWQATAKSRLEQAFELIQFGAFVNFYLSMLYGIDPAPIPWVDYFKAKLS